MPKADGEVLAGRIVTMLFFAGAGFVAYSWRGMAVGALVFMGVLLHDVTESIWRREL